MMCADRQTWKRSELQKGMFWIVTWYRAERKQMDRYVNNMRQHFLNINTLQFTSKWTIQRRWNLSF